VTINMRAKRSTDERAGHEPQGWDALVTGWKGAIDTVQRRHFGASLGLLAAAAAGSAPALAQAPSADNGESTWARIQRTKVIRTGVIAGEEPGFHKDPVSGEWSGSQLSFVRNIASTLGCQLELLETTYGNSVLDLQANKIDLALALQATPARSIVINFTRPIYFTQLVAVLRKGVEAKTWNDINKSSVRIAVDRGSISETIARHFAPEAQLALVADRNASTMEVTSGHADLLITSPLSAILAVKRNPQIGSIFTPQPPVRLGVYFGVRYEPNDRWVQFLNAWGEYNQQVGQIRAWVMESLSLFGLTPADVPDTVQF
jgi:polar amino acid transport system substrate-binding protein